MSKILRFINAEFISVKPNLKRTNLIIFAALSIAGYFVMGVHGLFMGIMPFTINLAAYTFSAGNDGLDALYVTLSIGRKAVVKGRYTFTILINLVASLVYFLIGLTLSAFLYDTNHLASFVVMAAGLFVVSSVISFVNLPILFKNGFKKSKTFISLVPMFVLLVPLIFSYVLDVDTSTGSFVSASDSMWEASFYEGAVAGTVATLLALIASWALIMFVSYLISLNFYTKRDF